MTDDYQCWENFGISIVNQGVDDYIGCLKDIDHGLNYTKDNISHSIYNTVSRKIECEKFFESDWCFFLSNIDGKKLIDRARKMANFDNDYFLKNGGPTK